MTIESSVSKSGPYAGAGLVGPFPVTFRFLDNSHLSPVLTSATGVETILVLNVDFTATGAGGDAGTGYVVTTVAVPVGQTLTIVRDVPITQLTDYTQSDPFPAQSHEDALDKLTMIAQQQSAELNSALRVPETAVSLPLLPAAADRANHILGFDSSGNPIGILPSAGDATTLAFDLLSNTSALKGAGQVGFSYSLAYAAGTIGRWLQDLTASTGSTLLGWIQSGTGAILRTVSAKLRERKTVADYGAKGDGVTDDGPAFRAAILANKVVYVDEPSVAYLISSAGPINVTDGKHLIGCGDGSCIVNVTAGAGVSLSANALFVLTGSGSVDGFQINYPNQCATDTVLAITVYPPTFLLNNSNLGSIKNVRAKGAYDLLRQDLGSFANLTLQNIYAIVLHYGAAFVGHMGDVSTAENVQIIHGNPNTGFNGGAVDLWCRANAIGWQWLPSGSNRIDLFRFTNSGVVGGSCAFMGGGNGAVWADLSNWHSDIASRAFIGKFSNLVLGNGWISQMDGFYSAPHTPAMQLTSSKVTMTNVTISLLATGSSAPIVGTTAMDLTMSNVRFSTSRGWLTPAIYCDFGLKLNASSCSVSTSNVTSQPLAFTDVCSFDLAGVTIDGKRAFAKAGTDIAAANFNMNAWGSGIPTNWTTALVTPSDYIRQLPGPVPGIEISPATPSTGAGYVEYLLSTSYSQMFGYFYVTGTATIVDLAGTAVIGTFEWSIGNTADGFNPGTAVLGNGGTSAECTGLPANAVQYFGCLLAAPLNPSDALAIRLSFSYPATTTQVKVRLGSLQLWNVTAYGTPYLENANGIEFLRPGAGTVRDSISGGVRLMRRLSTPTANNTLLGDVIVRNPQTVGQPKGWAATVAGNPGTWVSDGNR